MNEAGQDLSGHYQVQRSKIAYFPEYNAPMLITQYGWAKRGHETSWYETKIEPIRERKE